jgi:tetratricopeptide (TPR) repeat protein
LAAVAGWVDAQRLLPNVFTQGFVLAQATSETFPAYLAGEISEKSLWYYFPAAFLLKTPSVLLVLGGAGLLFFLGRRRSFGLANEVFVVLPIFVYLAFAMASGINIGVRHILPIYPFVLLIAAAAAKELLSWRRPVGRLVLVGMMAFWLVIFARVYPHTLTFFNVFARGPENGLAWLAESNLDWGQDLKLLSSWMRREKVEHINLAYFGTADPEYYAMRCTHLPGAPFFAGSKIARPVLPGYVAISETLLSGLYLTPEWRLFYAPFHQRETVARIGNSIRVYWVDQWPELLPAVHDPKLEVSLADALAFGLNWPDHAILHYRSVLDRGPADASVAGKLAVALLQSGKTDEAVDMFRQAIALNPGDGESHRSLAVVLLERRDLQTAETHARAAVQLLPKDAAAHDVLGLALVGTGQLEAAEAAFVEALRLVPNYEEARGHLQILRDWRRRQSRS